ncbi:hypothetical protein FACS189490_12940 [Clostridia bacterium]|nr:hypothetical protein FACS189490_12940 [Clostridia bacterium]
MIKIRNLVLLLTISFALIFTACSGNQKEASIDSPEISETVEQEPSEAEIAAEKAFASQKRAEAVYAAASETNEKAGEAAANAMKAWEQYMAKDAATDKKIGSFFGSIFKIPSAVVDVLQEWINESSDTGEIHWGDGKYQYYKIAEPNVWYVGNARYEGSSETGYGIFGNIYHTLVTRFVNGDFVGACLLINNEDIYMWLEKFTRPTDDEELPLDSVSAVVEYTDNGLYKGEIMVSVEVVVDENDFHDYIFTPSRQGYGVYTRFDRLYAGEWDNDLQNGYGIEYDKESMSVINAGKWHNGEFLPTE